MIDMVELESKDLVKDNIDKLKQIFPDIVKDGKIDFDTFSSRLSSGTLTDRSLEFAKLDLQGPNSKNILQKYFEKKYC